MAAFAKAGIANSPPAPVRIRYRASNASASCRPLQPAARWQNIKNYELLDRDEWQRKYGQNPRLDMGNGGDRAAREPAIA